jgi:hypothetical protein
MPIRNVHWYSINEGRSYPVADSATAISDQGDRLPGNIIADMNLRYPDTMGLYPFLSSVSVTDNLVSLTIQASTSIVAVSGFAPVAVLTVPKPVVEGRHYKVEAQVPGVGGWVVFGSGVVDKNYSGRFSGPPQSYLTPHAVRAYRPLPVSSIAKLHLNDVLTGIVNLDGVAPVEVVKETREIAGSERDVIVIRLVQPGGPTEGFIVGQETSVFEAFAGSCGKRPESQTCGDPAPIEFVNAVRPDCNGNLTVEFKGCATIAQVLETCGVVVDCHLNLDDACVPGTLPGADGKLRTEYIDQCAESESVVSEESESLPPAEESESVSDSLSVSEAPIGSLPYIECFDDSIADDFSVVSGAFNFVNDESPSEDGSCSGIDISYATEATLSASQRNISVWDSFDDSSINRKITTDLKLLLGPTGAGRNGGIIFNYRLKVGSLVLVEYFIADIDYPSLTLRVRRWNGNAIVPVASAGVAGIALDRWYRLTVSTAPGTGSKVQISVTLTNVGGPSLSASILPFETGNYFPDTGASGLHADRAHTRFSWFQVEEI